jgi:uncharacterized membrane protein
MVNVSHHNAHRGTIHAPMVTMDHAEAVELKQRRDAAFVKSTAGAVWGVAVAVLVWLVAAGVPAWIVGAINDSVAGFWWTFLVISVALVGAITLLMRSAD